MRHILNIITVAVLVHYTMAGSTDLPISQASNQFASELYKELAKTPGNVLVCPLSVHIALALVHQGAGGTTRSELANVLHLANSNIDVKNSYKSLLSGLQDDVLKIATKLYPAISFKPKAEYVSVAQKYFLSDIQPLDYGKAVDAANIINKFVENKTNNKIHDIIKPDSLSDLTRLVIVNAVHFKAGWARTFPPAFTGTFKVTPSQPIKTEFLGQTDYFPFKVDPTLDAKILKMDYENGKYSMVFVLPNKEGGLSELETKLATTSMDSLLSGMNTVRVDVTVPKFKIEQEIQLKDPLVKMGIQQMFGSRADLRDLAEGENLYVDSVIQKTFIDVNEKGTEAAAATGSITPLSGGSEEYTFAALRPFHFYVISNKPAVILFNGKLVKPKEKTKTPPKKANNPTNKQEGNSNYHLGSDGSFTFNRFGEEEPFSHNQGSVMMPSISHGQNINQEYLLSNNGQNRPAAPEHNQNPFYQAGHPNSGHYVQPPSQQTFAPSQHYGAQPPSQQTFAPSQTYGAQQPAQHQYHNANPPNPQYAYNDY